MISDAVTGRPPLLALALGLALSTGLVIAAPATPPAEVSQPPGSAEELRQQVTAAQRLVETVRGVPFKGSVASAFLAEKELPRLLEKKLVEDLPAPFPRYAASLAAVGLIEPQPDLLRKLVQLYSRQVAGFYDPSERKFYVVTERANLGGLGDMPELGGGTSGMLQEALLTHELTHALQDRRLDLDRRIKGLKESTDGLLALQAFLEGEATLVMMEALLSKLPEETRALLGGGDMLAELLKGLGAGGTPIEGSEGVPEFFVKELLFPYSAGTAWVQKRKQAGGWAAVDELYARPPRSTSEILHPERPLRPPAASSELRPTARELPAGAKPLYHDTLGEWVLSQLLERAGAGEEAARLAAQREDDRILYFEFEGEHVGFLWRIRCTSAESAARLAAALEPLYTGRPAKVRPWIRARESVVEVARGIARVTGESGSMARRRREATETWQRHVAGRATDDNAASGPLSPVTPDPEVVVRAVAR